MSQELESYQKRLRELELIIEECNLVSNNLNSEFWGLVHRTLTSLIKSYKEEVFKNSEKKDVEIRALLGKMEGLEYFLEIMENNFKTRLEHSLLEKEHILNLIQLERGALDKQKDLSYNAGTGDV